MDGSETAGKAAGKTGLRGWVKGVLILSLTLNFLVAGVVVGGILGNDRHPPRPPAPEELTFGPLTGAFSKEDRIAMRRAAEGGGTDFKAMRAVMRGDFDRLVAALQADPWDEAAVRAVLGEMRERSLKRMDLGEQVMLERLQAMTPEARKAFAARLVDGVNRFEHRFDPHAPRPDHD